MVVSPGLINEELLTGDDKIIAEAQRRFKQCETWESRARKLFLDDIKFSNGDSDNGYQWPNDIRRNRDVDERPCLTINKVHQHNLQIINDAKQNKPRAAVVPVEMERRMKRLRFSKVSSVTLNTYPMRQLRMIQRRLSKSKEELDIGES